MAAMTTMEWMTAQTRMLTIREKASSATARKSAYDKVEEGIKRDAPPERLLELQLQRRANEKDIEGAVDNGPYLEGEE
jgi:hypothetical protein